MKLSANFGSYGFNEEYDSIGDAIKKIEDLGNNSITEIIVIGGVDEGDTENAFRIKPNLDINIDIELSKHSAFKENAIISVIDRIANQTCGIPHVDVNFHIA